MKLPSQPTAKLSCLHQLLFWVKFLAVSTGHSEILPLFMPMPCVLTCWHTAAMSYPAPGCGRGERNSSPLQVCIGQSVLGSLSLSLLEVCTLELFLLVLLMSHGGKGAWKAPKLLFSICEQAPKSFGRSLQQPLVSVNNMIWFMPSVHGVIPATPVNLAWLEMIQTLRGTRFTKSLFNPYNKRELWESDEENPQNSQLSPPQSQGDFRVTQL